MTFFRSEEHLRNWTQFDPATADGMLPLLDLLKLFSGRMFSRRMDQDYVSHLGEYRVDFVKTLQEIGKTGPFWQIQM
jgi:hypothetical protein